MTDNKKDQNFEVGDRLRHPKFGEGRLIKQDDLTMTIDFEGFGEKKIGKGFVKITKVEN